MRCDVTHTSMRPDAKEGVADAIGIQYAQAFGRAKKTRPDLRGDL